MEKTYTHKETGSMDTREGWISSYSQEELEARGLTAEEAFDADEGVTLYAQEEDGTMRAVIEIRQDADGRYYARATGDRVSVREIEIVMDGDDGTHDLWAAAGYDGRRRMAIRRDAMSWLSDGTWRAYDYELVEIAER